MSLATVNIHCASMHLRKALSAILPAFNTIILWDQYQCLSPWKNLLRERPSVGNTAINQTLMFRWTSIKAVTTSTVWNQEWGILQKKYLTHYTISFWHLSLLWSFVGMPPPAILFHVDWGDNSLSGRNDAEEWRWGISVDLQTGSKQ